MRIVLRPLKHSLSQDLEAFSTVHLPLQELETMDLSDVLKLRHTLLLNTIKPRIQLLTLPFSQHGAPFLDQLVCLGDLDISLTALLQRGLLPFQALLFFEGYPVNHLESGRRAFFLDIFRFHHRF